MKLLTVFLLAFHALVATLLCLVAYRLSPPRLGIELGGGVQLVYAVDPGTGTGLPSAPDATGGINWPALIQALQNRVDPSQTGDVVVRQHGDQQVEIIIPSFDAEQIDRLKRQISTAGRLELRIVANPRDHLDIITLALAQAQNPDPQQRMSRIVARPADDEGAAGGEPVGFWAQAASTKLRAKELAELTLRNSATGAIVNLTELRPVRDDDQLLGEYLQENGLENVDMLVAINDGCDVTGQYLSMVDASTDEYLAPCVVFRLSGEGAEKMQLLTSANLPDTDTTPAFYRHLAILLDGQVLSFPRLITAIRDSGRITGSFTQDEVDFLVAVLRAGALPAQLEKTPIRESRVDANQNARQLAVKIAGVAFGVLVLVWLLIILSCGLLGVGGALASLLQVLCTWDAIVLTRMTVTLPLVIAATGISLLTAAGVLLVCLSVQPKRRKPESQPASLWQRASRTLTPLVIGLGLLSCGGFVAYAMGTSVLRSIAVPVVVGSTVAAFALGSCVVLPLAMLTGRDPRPEA